MRSSRELARRGVWCSSVALACVSRASAAAYDHGRGAEQLLEDQRALRVRPGDRRYQLSELAIGSGTASTSSHATPRSAIASRCSLCASGFNRYAGDVASMTGPGGWRAAAVRVRQPQRSPHRGSHLGQRATLRRGKRVPGIVIGLARCSAASASTGGRRRCSPRTATSSPPSMSRARAVRTRSAAAPRCSPAARPRTASTSSKTSRQGRARLLSTRFQGRTSRSERGSTRSPLAARPPPIRGSPVSLTSSRVLGIGYGAGALRRLDACCMGQPQRSPRRCASHVGRDVRTTTSSYRAVHRAASTRQERGFVPWQSGVDAMQVNLRGGTHYEWSYISNPRSRRQLRGIDTAAWYTTAWFDKYLKARPVRRPAPADAALRRPIRSRPRSTRAATANALTSTSAPAPTISLSARRLRRAAPLRRHAAGASAPSRRRSDRPPYSSSKPVATGAQCAERTSSSPHLRARDRDHRPRQGQLVLHLAAGRDVLPCWD